MIPHEFGAGESAAAPLLNADPVHLIGATGRTGRVLARRLAGAGRTLVAVVRDPARWAACGIAGSVRVAALTDPAALAAALADARTVISVAHAVHTRALLAAAPPGARLVLTGTARVYGDRSDAEGQDAALAEAALLASGRDGVMLHPTMIYGAPDDGTVQRLAGLVRRFPVLALPDGGRALVQPIHVEDLAACLAAAAARPWPAPRAIAVAGPRPLPFRGLLEAIAAALGQRRPWILPLPQAVARLSPSLMRLTQDRSAPIGPMLAELGVTPRELAAGLATCLGRTPAAPAASITDPA